MATSYDTIIIGLGSAGCTAASTLAQAGKRVLALEAQDRIGGRVNTVALEDGVIELGAEWIHGTKNSRVYNIGIQNNVSIISQDLEFKVYRSDGSLADQNIINELFEYTLSITDDPPKVPEPFGQYAMRRLTAYVKEKHPELLKNKNFLEEIFHFLDLVINNYEATNSWNEVTTESHYEELEGDQHMSWHKNGYVTFFQILLNTYKNGPGYPNLDIKLNQEVTLISWPQDPSQKVSVTCKDGTVYQAENVIVTASLGVLKDRHQSLFSPELSQTKINAIEKMSMGVVNKVALFFNDIWWLNNTFMAFVWNLDDMRLVPNEDYWITKIDGAASPMGNDKSLTFWLCGDYAKLKQWWPDSSSFFGFLWDTESRLDVDERDNWTTRIFGASCSKGSTKTITLWTCGETTKLVETLPEELVKTKLMELLRRFVGKNMTIPEPVSMLRSTWYSNPFTRGSYTYDNLQTPLNPNVRSDLGQPLLDSAGVPRVLFAGEATDPRHFSTVHGASDTGYREAMRLLSAASKL